jgi:hypothetical protein
MADILIPEPHVDTKMPLYTPKCHATGRSFAYWDKLMHPVCVMQNSTILIGVRATDCHCRITAPALLWSGGNGKCATYPTLEWFMQVPGTGAASTGRKMPGGADACTVANAAGCGGNCKDGLFWDPGTPNAGFMDRAVIYGLNLGQGNFANNVVGYVGSLTAYTTSGSPVYGYTWVFK